MGQVGREERGLGCLCLQLRGTIRRVCLQMQNSTELPASSSRSTWAVYVDDVVDFDHGSQPCATHARILSYT